MCEFLVSLQHESICPFECFGGPGPYAELCKGVVYAAAYYPQPVPHGQWSMVCPKYGKYFKLVQGGKTFMKKA